MEMPFQKVKFVPFKFDGPTHKDGLKLHFVGNKLTSLVVIHTCGEDLGAALGKRWHCSCGAVGRFGPAHKDTWPGWRRHLARAVGKQAAFEQVGPYDPLGGPNGSMAKEFGWPLPMPKVNDGYSSSDTVEIASSGGYARKSVVWSKASGGTVTNATPIMFSTPSPVTITGVSVGNVWLTAKIPFTEVKAGEEITFEPGTIKLSIT